MEPQTTDTLTRIKENIERVIVGKSEAIDLVLICLLCGGHALIEDVPGLGKTSLVSALADSIDCSFQRIQFTPDVLPSDVTGFTLYHPTTGERQFYRGAVMSQIVLADEINRTSPKTQSALLQAMQEGVVTVDGETHRLPRPFMVCATQNPVEQTGTYPLPEAQLDRFLMRISMGYPALADEVTILERNKSRTATAPLSAVADAAAILALQDELEAMTCMRSILTYIVDIARRTREHPDVELGVSPRGSIALMKAAMARAMLSGRNYVLPDDVQRMTAPVLAHRLVLTAQAYIQNQTAEAVLTEILRLAPVPAVTAG
ncbi:MoxR family ATPase [Ruminococcaceae bacterium OttesenSCG-928-L11]|nr:MoxR family ATPase [Ruminococcaceae bacterium OttesenSCG-928-L11]